MRPTVTISFECKREIHTYQLVEIYNFISSSDIFVDFIKNTVEEIEFYGEVRDMLNAIDPSGDLCKDFEEKFPCAQ